MLDINSTQFSALKMNPGLTDIKNFKSDSHGVGNGGLRGPPLGVFKEPKDIRHVGYQLFTGFNGKNEYKVNKSLRFIIGCNRHSQMCSKFLAIQIAIYFNLVKLL